MWKQSMIIQEERKGGSGIQKELRGRPEREKERSGEPMGGGVLIWESVRREWSGAYRNRGEGLYEVKKIGPFGKVGALWTSLICRDPQPWAMAHGLCWSSMISSCVSCLHVCSKIRANILIDFLIHFFVSKELPVCKKSSLLVWCPAWHIGWASKIYFLTCTPIRSSTKIIIIIIIVIIIINPEKMRKINKHMRFLFFLFIFGIRTRCALIC
jgi:hypothetical protein